MQEQDVNSNLFQLKRKRLDTLDPNISSCNSLQILSQSSSLLSEPSTEESLHWRKLRLLEARLVGRVLGLEVSLFINQRLQYVL